MSRKPVVQHCKTCDTPLSGPYCHRCGEKVLQPEDLTLRHYFSQIAGQVFQLDGRLWRSFWLLLRRPGLLTREYLEGRRRPYLRPVQMFLIANMVYFIFQPLTGAHTFNTSLKSHLHRQLYSPIAQKLIPLDKLPDPQAFQQRFDTYTNRLARSLIFLMIPMLAVLLRLMNQRSSGGLFACFVFSTHFYAFVLLYFYSLFLLPYVHLARVLHTMGVSDRILVHEAVLTFANVLFTVPYFYVGLRRVFNLSRLSALLQALAFPFVSFLLILSLYRLILFLIVWVALH